MLQAKHAFRTKREHAVAKVKDAIMFGRYRPGQSLRQGQLMADLDFGATPAREAALELVANDEHLDIADKFAQRNAAATARAVERHILHGLDAFNAILEAGAVRNRAKPT